MNNNETNEVENKYQLLLSHTLVAVVTVVALVVLQGLQPWQGSSVTEVNSFRMSISASYTDGEMTQETFQEMAYITPDRTQIIVNPEDEHQEIILIGEVLYANDARYIAGIDVIMSIKMSIEAMVPSQEQTKITFERLVDVEELAIKRIDGVTCRHYQGRMDYTKNIEEQIASLDPEQPNYEFIVESLNEQLEEMREIKTIIDIWLGKDDGFIRQICYEAQMPSDYSESLAVSKQLIKYYDINKSITIEPPVDSSGELLPGWYKAGF